MPIRVPFSIVYETDELVSLPEIIESLRGINEIGREVSALIEIMLDGVTVEALELSVIEISQKSPLTELLAASVAIALQPDLRKEIPGIFDSLTGSHAGHDYPAIITLLFSVVTIYGVHHALAALKGVYGNAHIQAKLDCVISDLANACGLSEEDIKRRLDRRFTPRRLRAAVFSALKVFLPSKNHHNAPMRIEPILFEKAVVAEVPSNAQMLDFDPSPTSRSLQKTSIEIHAQDLDRSKVGWAGIVRAVSSKRLRMELYPTIQPDKIYTKSHILGDIIVEFKIDADGEEVPSMFHLIHVYGEQA